MATIFGTAGNDMLTGTGQHDVIMGLGGDDHLVGGAEIDWLDGGPGADRLDGGESEQDLAWYADNSRQMPTVGVSVNLETGVGSGGDAEGDSYFSIENVRGTPFADTLTGDDGKNGLIGNGGDDTLLGGGGDDLLDARGGGVSYLDGGGGNDRLMAGDGAGDTLDGALGDDFLVPGAGLDTINGGFGVDTVQYSSVANPLPGDTGGVAVDLLVGRADGGDRLIGIENAAGSDGDDLLGGNDLRNRLSGFNGDDELRGGRGHDVLDGGDGDDRLIGGAGNDFLRGGGGDDSFVFTVEAGSRDRIVDFDVHGGDQIVFTAELADNAGIHNFEDVLAWGKDTPEGVYIDLNGDHPWTFGILIAHTELGELGSDDFAFG